jgi:serine/threonine protein phosphatase 1
MRAGRTPADMRAGRTPAGTRVYAIGDIHGCIGLLDRLQASITADIARDPPARAVVVYLGDYVDRGPDSKAVIERLAAGPVAGSTAVHLMGNHERLMMQALASREPRAVDLWLQNGGSETLRSYGIDPARPGERFEPGRSRLTAREGAAAMESFSAALPPSHRAFLAGLALWHKEGGYVFVHAGIRPNVPLARQRDEDLLWIREPFLQSTDDFGFVVIHGHTVRPEPEIRPNRIGIDTGAYVHGRLCCSVLDGAERRFLFS